MKLNGVCIIEIPKFRAVTSGYQTLHELFSEDGFGKWVQRNNRLIRDLLYASPDFMWHEGDKSVWIWAVNEWVTEADVAPYNLVDFEGGVYVVSTGDENNSDDLNEVISNMVEFINHNALLEMDDRLGHRGMCHMTGCGVVNKTLGIAQQVVYLPVKFKDALS